MLLRVRSNVGIWRVSVNDDDDKATTATVLDSIQQTRPEVVYETDLCLDPACKHPVDPQMTLKEQGFENGSMVYCKVDPATTATAEALIAAASSSDTMETETSAPAPSPPNAAAPKPSATMRRIIGADGSIQLVPAGDMATAPAGEEKGFRPGMMALRDIKMQWTLNDFVAMDSQFEFKIQRQKQAVCQQVSLDTASITDFYRYVQSFQFQRKRVAWCYGRFVPVDGDGEDDKDDDKKDGEDDDKATKKMKAVVEAIYEPPQRVDTQAAEGFVLLEDEEEDDGDDQNRKPSDSEKADHIASLLGLRKVGWIFSRDGRDNDTKKGSQSANASVASSVDTAKTDGSADKDYGIVMTSAEIIMTAELQLEAADGVNETPFVTIIVSPGAVGAEGAVSVEAFQVSQQCMAMVAEEALLVGDNPKVCTAVHPTFTAIQEGKPSPTIDNNFFLTVVPIQQHKSEMFVAQFPRANRDVVIDERAGVPSHDQLRKQLSQSGRQGWNFEELLTDLNLLVYLSQFLDMEDLSKICTALLNHQRHGTPLDDGYKLIIKSLAGMEGSY